MYHTMTRAARFEEYGESPTLIPVSCALMIASFDQMSRDEFAAGIATYVAAHYSLAGWSMDTGVPIPPKQPQELPDMTFMQYLESIGIGHLKNAFT